MRKRILPVPPVASLLVSVVQNFTTASSHREARMVSNDPLADNYAMHAFRSPNDTNTVTIAER